MTKKNLKITAGLYVFFALVMIASFIINWHMDGMPKVSTMLFGFSGVCFAVSAVLSMISLYRGNREAKEEK